ncbi:MAG: SDR family oxidoreductase [Acidimicrobiales bacterium]|nr:SDR family oxidoreductase [Acidimicrobiales bacterium]
MNKRILVTGASSGIGTATARAIVASGGSVALMARSADALSELAAELGERAVAVPADVTDADTLDDALAVVENELGGLDGVVNAAGVVRPGGIDRTGPDDWKAMFDVNVLGLLNVTHAALPLLRDNDVSDVINISSMSGRRRASVAMTIYSATKFAVHVISDGLREELADDQVRVTVISPGYVQTPIFDDVSDDALRTRYQDALEKSGLEPSAVADQVVHALDQPAGVNLIEIALLSTGQ